MDEKRKRIILIISFVLVIIVVICIILFFSIRTKNDDVKIYDNVITITSEDVDAIPLQVNEDNLVYSTEQKYKTGDVIVAGILPTSPNGFIRKVIGVKNENGQYIVETTNAYLSDVFEKAHIEKYITLSDTEANVNNSLSNSTFTAMINPQTASVGIQANDDKTTTFLIDFNKEIADYLSVNGKVELTPVLFVKLDIENKETQFTMSLKNKSMGDMNIVLGTGDNFEQSINIYEKDLKAIEFSIGPVPIVITNSISLDIDLSGSISGDITTTVKLDNFSNRGFTYDSNTQKITEINETSYDDNDKNITWKTESNAEATFEAGLSLSLTSKLYDVFGGTLTGGVAGNESCNVCISPYEKFNGLNYAGNVALSVVPSIKGEIIVDTPLIDENLLSQTLFEVSLKPLWEKSWSSSDTWKDNIQTVINKTMKRIYTTKRTETYKCEQPEFSFKYPNGWNLVKDELTDTYELGVIENERGVSVTFCECNSGFASTNYGGGYRLDVAKVSEIKKSSFVPDWISGTDYSSIGDFVIAKVEVYGYYNMKSENESFVKHSKDDIYTYYAIVPKTKTIEFDGLIQFKGLGYWDALSWNYPSPVATIAESPDGTFTTQEEREVIAILSSFKENK